MYTIQYNNICLINKHKYPKQYYILMSTSGNNTNHKISVGTIILIFERVTKQWESRGFIFNNSSTLSYF